MKLKTLVLAAITATSVWAADTLPLTFNAVLIVGKEQRFGLASSSGTHSEWLGLGGSFEGYKLQSFDGKTQALTLEREGKTFQLPLATASIQAPTTKATVSDAMAVLDKMKFEQMMTRMVEQQKQAMSGMSKQMLGSMAGKISPEDYAAYQTKIVDVLWSQMKPEELKADFSKMYAELFTKDELQGMTDFYSTPAGQALIDKGPEMQQRMMQVMMPRMMKAMPQIQELSRQFSQEQQAKQAAAAPVAPPAPTTK